MRVLTLKSVRIVKATMLKKRKRRKVNRRHTEPGLGASSGVAGEASGGILVPSTQPSSTIPGISEASASASTSNTSIAVPSFGSLNSSGSGGTGGGKPRRALTALRSEAAMGASQYTLHSQVRQAKPSRNLLNSHLDSFTPAYVKS